MAPSFEHWYRTGVLSPHVRGLWSVGAMEGTLIDSVQPAGDLSDPATPDLVLGVAFTLGQPARIVADLGFGKVIDAVRSDHCFLLPAHAANEMVIDGPTRSLTLSMPHVEVLEALKGVPGCEQPDFGKLHAGYFHDPFLLASVWRLRDLCAPEHATHGIARETLLLSMLIRLAELSASGGRMPKLSEAPGGLARWQVRRVVDRLHADLARSPSLGELAASIDLSAHHFCRAFKVSVGRSPIQYLIEQRMQRAAGLLASTRLPIAEIAAEVGYEDPSYFARLFREKTGKTPSAIRGL